LGGSDRIESEYSTRDTTVCLTGLGGDPRFIFPEYEARFDTPKALHSTAQGRELVSAPWVGPHSPRNNTPTALSRLPRERSQARDPGLWNVV